MMSILIILCRFHQEHFLNSQDLFDECECCCLMLFLCLCEMPHRDSSISRDSFGIEIECFLSDFEIFGDYSYQLNLEYHFVSE